MVGSGARLLWFPVNCSALTPVVVSLVRDFPAHSLVFLRNPIFNSPSNSERWSNNLCKSGENKLLQSQTKKYIVKPTLKILGR